MTKSRRPWRFPPPLFQKAGTRGRTDADAELTGDMKAALRQTARTCRAACAKNAAGAAEAAAERLAAVLDRVHLPHLSTIAAYWPVSDELDTRPFMDHVIARGHRLALPVVAGTQAPLVFRVWRPGDPLLPGAFGIPAPPAHAPAVRPVFLVVPLLAFDAAGTRLGYGGGYYDRTLRALHHDGGPRPWAVGLAYEVQRVDRLPFHDGDQSLDAVATEVAVHVMNEEIRV